jgi:hypothetical protein
MASLALLGATAASPRSPAPRVRGLVDASDEAG